MSKKNDLNMGFDPLEWLREEPETNESVAPDESPAAGPAATEVEIDSTDQQLASEATPEAEFESVEVVGEAASAEGTAESYATESGTVQGNGGSETVIALPDGLHIANVGETYGRMVEAINAGGTVVIDFCDAEMIDGAGVQLLLAFVTQVQQNGMTLEWRQVPEAVKRDVALSGAQPALW